MSTRLTFAYVKPSRVFSATGTNLFYTEGNVGIGLTNPTSTFEVNGNVNIDSGALFVNSANNNVGINTTTPTTALDVSGATTISGNLNVDNNTLFVDAASNRVGIGMNNPSKALEINGTARVSSNLDVSGNIIAGLVNNVNLTIPLYTTGYNIYRLTSGTAGIVVISSISGANAKYIGIFEWTDGGTSNSLTQLVSSGAISVYLNQPSAGQLWIGASAGNNSNSFSFRVILF